ncbi:galactosylceramide sulfotransferase-like [Narcine bancroftii]|uniref:galactosylceramide sulfotransferase-like n=1 Tax=Narcine bancroftii TaxID=1343680 RepID=UPI00383213EB
MKFWKIFLWSWKGLHRILLIVAIVMSLFIVLFTLYNNHFSPPSSCARQSPPPVSPTVPTTCSPHWDLLFLKTHKTGSSTLLNILLRYSERHGLTFAFPSGGRHDFYYPSFFSPTFVSGYSPSSCFNVLANHMRFDAGEVERIPPRERLYFTILRFPSHLFESSFRYYGPIIPLTWSLPGPDKMATFLHQPWAFYRPGAFNAHYLRNLQFFDLGFDKDMDPSHPALPGILRSIEERFSLVMLMEYFDESLVLLKDVLCWELEDILYLPHNSREQESVAPLVPKMEELALLWNHLDYLLYRHFNHTFWAKVETFGRLRMAQELARLRWANAKLVEACVEGGRAVRGGLVREASLRPWQPVGGDGTIIGYNLKHGLEGPQRQLCQDILTPELQYMSRMGANLWRVKVWAAVRGILRW